MNSFIQQTGFEPIDLFAFVSFFVSWFCFEYVQTSTTVGQRSLSGHMVHYRQRWMENMMLRDPRMVDALIQNSLQQGVLFFASTSILLVGALLAGLGASDEALRVLGDIPFASKSTRIEWELKILLMTFIFVYAFFKFAWSYRLFNYVIIIIGAAPIADGRFEMPDTADMRQHAAQLSKLHTLAARHFSAGVNAYFQALAAIAWFISGWLFLIATLWVLAVRYRRAYRARSLRILRDSALNPEKIR